MTFWEYISFTKIVSINNYNDWIINRDLTKFHHCMSNLRSFNVRRGFLEILFLTKFQTKKFSYKSVMIIVSYQRHNTVSNPPENTVDSYFIAGFVLSRHWRISRQI